MKVDKLCIINFGGEDKEAKACSLGLLVKYAITRHMKNENVGAFSYCAENKAALNNWVSSKGELNKSVNYPSTRKPPKI
jgi:hypothetical protein